LSVLVGAGEEAHVAAGEPLVAGHGVGGHGAVGVADVELVRGVVDGRGDIELVLFHRSFSFKTAAPNGRDAGIDGGYSWFIIPGMAGNYKRDFRGGGFCGNRLIWRKLCAAIIPKYIWMCGEIMKSLKDIWIS